MNKDCNQALSIVNTFKMLSLEQVHTILSFQTSPSMPPKCIFSANMNSFTAKEYMNKYPF